MKELFIPRKFSAENQAMITTINQILEEYRAQGYRLSLRQLYYQLVARDYIPNSQKSYKNTGALVSNARLAGLIDWDMIEDRGRETVSVSHWTSPAQILRAVANQYRIDKWANQPYHIEVMVEKDALSGVLEPVCRRLDIPITANKGYSSSSTMYEIGGRLYHKHIHQRKKVCIIYLGDHDPSGIDMTRDVNERLTLFAGGYHDAVEVVRLALNYDQVQRWNPPPNPAKESDSRIESYRAQFGNTSWELDAIEPVTLAGLVESAVLERRDEDRWIELVDREADERAALTAMADQWDADHADDADDYGDEEEEDE